MVFLKEFFEKVDFEKNWQTTKKHEKFPRGQRVKTGWKTEVDIYGPCCEKPCLRGFRQSEIQTSLLSYRD